VCVPLHISVTLTDLSLISRYLYTQRARLFDKPYIARAAGGAVIMH